MLLSQTVYPHHGLVARPCQIYSGEDIARVGFTLHLLQKLKNFLFRRISECSLAHLHLCVCLPRYLEVEWEVKKGTQRSFGKDLMKGSSPRVPQQDNFSDCGVYVLQYVESFFEV